MTTICPITVRPATAEDLRLLPNWFPTEADLIQWGGPLLRFPLDQPQLEVMWAESRLAPPRRLIWSGCLVGGDIAAHAQAALDPAKGTARLARIGLNPKLRGRGLAYNFLQRIVALLRRQPSVSTLELNVYAFNQPAIRLYRRLGFEPQEVKAGPVVADGERWDVIRMTRPIDVETA